MSEPQVEEKKSGGWGPELWEIAKVILISLAIVLPIRYYIAQPFIVRGASMEPNFEDHEYLIIDEVSYYFRQPQRGEAIVFRYPRNPRQFFIKRIIGLPGEKIEIRGGKVRVTNEESPKGFILDEKYLEELDKITQPDGTTTLKENEFFVMGDNRDSSSDSRFWGPLSENLIVGRAVFRAWPVNRLGLIPEYSF